MYRRIIRILPLLLIVAMLCSMCPFASAAKDTRAVASASHTVASQKSYSVLDGMTETTLLLKDKKGNSIDGHMMEIAPGAAVTAKVSYPNYYKAGSTPESRKAFADKPVWSKKTTTGQAADFTAATGQPVIFAINTDNFITEATETDTLTVGQCCGHLIMEGNICQTTEIRSRPFFAVLKDGSFVIRDASGDLSDVVEATSGRIYIVKDGQNVVDPAHSEELGLQPFNSIGLKKDGTVVVFQVDGRRSDSVGFTELEMAEYLLAQGVYTALILDGGGSATFTSRREGDSKLTVRNQPSDGTERALGSTLHFVSSQESLFFDYSADTTAQKRYASYTYNGNNFDIPSAWKPTAGTADTVAVGNGILTITKSAANTLGYCYVQTQSSSGKPLRFRPNYSDYLQIRMRLKGFDPAASNTNFSIHFYADGATTQTTNAVLHKFGAGYVFDGSSILLTLPVAQKFRDAEFVDGVKLNFSNLSGGGTIEIDYLYIGPKVSLPEQDFLFFDFQGTTFDADRYASKTYGFQNFDTQGWGYNGKKSSAPQISGDEMTFEVMATTDNYGNTGHSPYIHTVDLTGNMTASALCYRTSKQDYFQIRFRMKDCSAVSGLTPMVRLYFAADGKQTFVGNVKKDLTDAEMTSDTYYVVTLPLYSNSAYASAEILDYFRLNFQNVRTADGKTGKITIDYLYIGPQESLPRQDALFMDFTGDAAAELRYRSKTYAFQNFDSGFWAYNPKKCEKPAFSNGAMVITLAPTTDNYVNTGHSPYVQTSDVNATVGKTVLRYQPGEKDFVQIRLKMENCTAVSGKTAMLRFFYTNDDTASTAGYVNQNLTAAQMRNGEYFVVTWPLYTQDSYQASEFIRRIQITMQNLRSADGKTGKISVDYIYVGAESRLPTPRYTVTFVGADGKTLQTQTVHKGETAAYTGVTPTKGYDATNHYTFKGWDKSLSNITTNVTTTAQFTAAAHSYTYAKVDNTNHKGTCSCGHSKTLAHTWNSGTVTTAATCTAAGVKTYTCTTCKATKTETIASTGHTVVLDKAVAATCTANGLTEGKHCAVCNEILVAQETVAALGHNYGYVSNGDGTHTATCTRCSNSYTKNHNFILDRCICGDKELTLDEGIQIYHTLDLASDISVSFVVPVTSLASYDSYYLECILPEYEGNAQVGTSAVKIQPVLNGNYYYFTLTGITAVRMGDMVDAVLHMTKGTQTYISKTDSYSVATYAYAMLNGTNNTKMLTLCADLLRYGAEAQKFKKYRTDALVDANMNATHRSYLSNTNALTFTATDKFLGDLENAAVTWVGKTLDLGSKVGMKFVFNAKNYSGDISKLSMKVSYQGSNGETKTVTMTGAEVYNAANAYYSFTFDGLLASELRTVVDVAIYQGNTQLSETLRYSPETYASKAPATLEPLTHALFAYSDSAKNFFA